MATSGTTNFNLNIEELIEEAYSLVGGELISGEDLVRARTALNLLFIDMQNRGHPLAKLENIDIATSTLAANYVLDSDVIDVLNLVNRRDGLDTAVQRMPLLQYHEISNKSNPGRSTQFAVDRDLAAPVIYVYPASPNNTDVLNAWVVKRIQDAGNFINEPDFTSRYLPAIVFGLAYFLSIKRQVDPGLRRELLANYKELLDNAFTEDNERSSYRPSPHPYFR